MLDPVAISLATSVLAALGAAASALWRYIRSREEQCQREKEQLRAELKEERLDHFKTLKVYAALHEKREREQGPPSSPPPSS